MSRKESVLLIVVLFLAMFVACMPVWTAEPAHAKQASGCSFQVARDEALKQAQDTEITIFDSSVVPYRQYLRRKDGSLYRQWCYFKGKPISCSGYRRVEIPLWLLDTNTCTLQHVSIARKVENGLLVLENLTPGVTVDIEEGAHGRIWNGYNTPYFSPSHPSYVVVLNAWKPARRGADPIYYSPHSLKSRAFFPHLAEHGLRHYNDDVWIALEDLWEKKTRSRAFPSKYLAGVAGTWFMPNIAAVPFIEQADHRWFEEFEAGIDEFNPYRRVAEIIGTNGDFAYDPTRSSAGAAGLMQIWPNSCVNVIRGNYPDAHIPEGCGSSADIEHHGHIEAIKSAIAHLDSTLNDFMIAERRTGFFGFITRNYMNATAKPGDTMFTRDLSQGMAKGDDVRELQKRLGITPDGLFGSQTRAAVAAYQDEHFDEMFTRLASYEPFLTDLGERQVAAYNSAVGRVIRANKTWLDKWDEVHLYRDSRGKLQTSSSSLVYETVMYLRIFRYLREHPEAIYE